MKKQMRTLIIISCVLVILTLSQQAGAQQSGGTQPKVEPPKAEPQVTSSGTSSGTSAERLPNNRNDPDVESADIAIIANITAKELRFDVVPNPTVEFLDKLKNQTIWQAERINLPDKIEPGVTYRNIGIRLKITSRLADIERIVAEALGEVPISESNSTKTTQPGTPAVKPPRATPPQPETGNQRQKP